jgi:hypothetical protein
MQAPMRPRLTFGQQKPMENKAMESGEACLFATFPPQLETLKGARKDLR